MVGAALVAALFRSESHLNCNPAFQSGVVLGESLRRLGRKVREEHGGERGIRTLERR